MRGFYRILGAACFLPAIVIALWGAIVLVDFVRALNGGSFQVLVHAGKGDLMVQVNGLRISLPPHVDLDRAEVKEMDGRLLIAANKVSLGSDALTLSGPWTGDIGHLWARVDRNRDGTFAMARYLSAPKGEPQEVPFSIYVARSTVVYTDRSGGPSFRRVVRGQDTLVSGSGERLWARSGLDIEKTGRLGIEVHSRGPSAWLEASGGLRPADWISHFARTPEGQKITELKDFNLRGGWVNGDYRLDIDNKVSPKLLFSGKGDLTGIRYREFGADRVGFRGNLTDGGFAGTYEAAEGGTKISGDGKVVWANANYGLAHFNLQARSVNDLPAWAKKLVPRDLRFTSGNAQGWLNWDGGAIRLAADTSASGIEIAGETVASPKAKLSLVDGSTVVQVTDGRWMGAPVQGVFALRANERLEGGLQSGDMDLGKLARRFKLADFGGRAKLNLVLGGTTKKPEASFFAQGQAVSRVPGYSLSLGQFVGVGDYRNGVVNVNRLKLGGPSGKFLAKGNFNPQTQDYSFDMEGYGIPISALTKEAAGQLAFVGKVSGKGTRYTGSGKLEVFDAEAAGQKLAFLSSGWKLLPGSFEAESFVALQKGLRGEGTARVNLKTQALSGNASVSGLQLADFAGEGIEGFADLRNGNLGGTLQKPQFQGDVSARSLVAGPLKLTNLTGQLRYGADNLVLDRITAQSETGAINGSARLNTKTQIGKFQADWKDLEAEGLLPTLASAAKVGGKLTGTAAGTFKGIALESLTGKTDLFNLSLNDQVVGSGELSFSAKGTEWKGSAEVGQIDQYMAVRDLIFDSKEKTISARVVAGDLQLPQLEAIGKRYLDDYAAKHGAIDSLERLRQSTGKLSVDATIDGKLDDPIVDLQTLELADWMIGEIPGGAVKAKGSRSNRLWTVDSLTWEGPANLSLSGSIDEEGETHLTGALTQLKASWLSWVDPRFNGLTGTLSAPLIAIDGKTQEPSVEASLGYSEDGNVAVDLIAKMTQGQVTAEGTYFFKGFTGAFEGNAPFDYSGGIPEDGEIEFSAKSDPRTISSLADYFPWLDSGRSQGSLTGDLKVRGTRSKPIAQATIDGKDAILAASELNKAPIDSVKVGTMVLSPNISVRITPDAATLSASGKGSDGGEWTVSDAAIGFSDLSAILGGDAEALLDSPVTGDIRITGLKLQAIDKAAGKMETLLSSEALRLMGTVREPLLKGTVYVDKSTLVIPTMKEGGPAGAAGQVNPRFDLDIITKGPIDFKAGTGGFRIGGQAHVGGSLEDLQLDAPLVAESGSIRLPNARIAIDPGGTIRLSYRGGAMITDLNLGGRTQLTATGITGNVERYDISLEIRGDIMKDGGLQLRASADPPDLPQDRILALLGQRELIAGVATETNISKQIQSAVMGVALPYLGSSLTDRLASAFGLDYLNVDYNAFEQISIAGGVALNKHFSLSGRRQISQPLPGFRPKWDLRLSYRPQFGPKTLRRTSFSIGMDQDRPWRIAVEYGIRF